MAETEGEKGYEVVDKRKVRIGEDGEVYAEPEPAQPIAGTEASVEEVSEEEMSGLPPVDVYSLLKSFIGILGAHAWQWLGLVKNPMTGQMERDLEQAKTAIDSINALVSGIEGKLSEQERQELAGLISDLRINFVQQSAKGS